MLGDTVYPGIAAKFLPTLRNTVDTTNDFFGELALKITARSVNIDIYAIVDAVKEHADYNVGYALRRTPLYPKCLSFSACVRGATAVQDDRRPFNSTIIRDIYPCSRWLTAVQ